MVMTESHLAHAVATFSELGIATAAVLLADVPKWRDTIKAAQDDPIEVENLKVQAKRLGRRWYFLLCFAELFSSSRVLYPLPFVAALLGIFALIGISFYPVVIGGWFSFLAFEREMLDRIYWAMAFASFVLAMVAAAAERTSAKLAEEAGETKKTPLGE